MKKKKYAFGGSTDPLAGLLGIRASRKGEDPGFIESPDTAIAQNNIMKAKAMQKANSNPWTQGLDILGSLAVQYGTSMMNSGMSSMGGGASAGTEMEGAGAMFNSDYAFNGNSQVPKLKFGGKVKGSQVEVEGEEVGELPNGQLLEFKGPSHEAGGIDAILPGGTDIFSKRISIDGVSMADRKKKREKQANRISKRLNENSADPVLKNTSKRIQEVNEMEDAFDMNVQEMFTPKTKEKFAGGGTVPGYKAPDWMSNITMQDLTDSYGFVDSDILNKASEEGDAMTENITQKNSFFDNLLGDVNSASMPTVGDALGIFGNLKQAYDPMKMTLENRAGDTPNVNSFKDFGKDGLKAIQKSKGYIAEMRDKNISDLNLSKAGAITKNRGTASSVNTQRALDISTNSQANRSLNDIYSNFASQMMGIIGQEAQMENQQDQVVMGGEAQRDLADRQDRDAFYTNISRDKQAVGEAISRTGKAVNEIKGRGVDQKLLNQMSDYAQVNVMNGSITAKQGLNLIGAGNGKNLIKKFTTNKGYEALGYTKNEWDKLNEEQQARVYITKQKV